MSNPGVRRNVWILNQYAGVTDGQSRAFELGRHAVQSGHAVTVFAAGRNHYTGAEHRRYDRFGAVEEWFDGVRFVWIRTPADRTRRFRNMSGYAFRAVIAGLRQADRPDVVIGSCPHPLAGAAAYLLARIHRARFLYEIRDLWPQTGVDQGLLAPRAPATLVLARLEKFLITRAHGVVTVLANLREYLERRHIRQDTVWVIPNGVDASLFPLSNGRRPAPASVFRLLYAGGFSNYHGLSVVLDAAELLRRRGRTDIEITMIGDGPQKQALVAAAAERGLENIRFGNHQPKKELPALLQKCDATLFTFRRLSVLDYGISPLKIFDYMAAARPVIFAAAAWNNPVAEAGAGVTVEPDDAEALAGAIEQLADMPAVQREEMGRNGRTYVEAHHSVEVLGRRFEAAIAGQGA